MRLTKNNQSGISTIEIIIVGLIVAVVATAAVPIVQRNLELYRAESAVKIVSIRLMDAKFAALKRNRTARLEINTDSNSLEIRSTNDAGADISISPPLTLPEGTVVAGIGIVSTAFNSLGRNQAGTMTTISMSFPNVNQCKDVSISPAGKVSINGCP